MGMGNCYLYNNEYEQNIYFKLFKNESKDNKITLFYKIDSNEKNIRLIGSKFYENNKDKCLMCINFIESDLIEFYKANNNDSLLIVTIEISPFITDLSYMFYECSSLILISNLYNLNVDNVTDISNMFFGCTSLKSLSDISK